MEKFVQVDHPHYGLVVLNVERVIAVCLEKRWLLFEDAYWQLNQEDFDKVCKAWYGKDN